MHTQKVLHVHARIHSLIGSASDWC